MASDLNIEQLALVVQPAIPPALLAGAFILPCMPWSQVESVIDRTVRTAEKSAGAVVYVMSMYVAHSRCHVVSGCELVCPGLLLWKHIDNLQVTQYVEAVSNSC